MLGLSAYAVLARLRLAESRCARPFLAPCYPLATPYLSGAIFLGRRPHCSIHGVFMVCSWCPLTTPHQKCVPLEGARGQAPGTVRAGVLFRQLIPQEGISFLIYTFGLSPSLNHFLFHLTISPKSCRKVSFPIITAYLNARKSLLILVAGNIEVCPLVLLLLLILIIICHNKSALVNVLCQLGDDTF